MVDKLWPVESRPWYPTVSAPERLLGADLIEVRVELIPLRWFELETQYRPVGERAGSQCQITRIEAKDHRAVFHVTRQMINELFRHYMGLEINP